MFVKRRFQIKYMFPLLAIGLMACGSSIDEPEMQQKVPVSSNDRIPLEFRKYVENLATEAKNRGVTLNLASLKVVFSDTLGPQICGRGVNNNVYISPECWKERTDSRREALMFHEIGHATLGRGHLNSKLPNGDAVSVMIQGALHGLYNKYTPERRTYYIDELLGLEPEIPNWAEVRKNQKIVFNDSILNSDKWQYINKSGGSLHSGTVSNTVFASVANSLSITAESPSGHSFWRYEFEPEGLKQSSFLTLRAKVKLEGISGEGVSLALRGTNGDGEETFYQSSIEFGSLKGDWDFIDYSAEIRYYIEQTKKIELQLVMEANTTGTVYFDDVRLTVRE